jgi:hypothetical protein
LYLYSVLHLLLKICPLLLYIFPLHGTVNAEYFFYAKNIQWWFIHWHIFCQSSVNDALGNTS